MTSNGTQNHSISPSPVYNHPHLQNLCQLSSMSQRWFLLKHQMWWLGKTASVSYRALCIPTLILNQGTSLLTSLNMSEQACYTFLCLKTFAQPLIEYFTQDIHTHNEWEGFCVCLEYFLQTFALIPEVSNSYVIWSGLNDFSLSCLNYKKQKENRSLCGVANALRRSTWNIKEYVIVHSLDIHCATFVFLKMSDVEMIPLTLTPWESEAAPWIKMKA